MLGWNSGEKEVVEKRTSAVRVIGVLGMVIVMVKVQGGWCNMYKCANTGWIPTLN